MSDFELLIIGAGASGIGAAVRLAERGSTDFALLEKADDIGGTWRDNTYPGCACDVPSALYSYSFAPNPGWSRVFAGQPEIREYLRDTARRFGVLDRVRFGVEVLVARWDQGARRWRLDTNRGEYTVVAVTGGARGIGKATANLFTARGAAVCVGDLDGGEYPLDTISAATMNVNVWGLIHGMRLVLPHMIARGRGHVVNVASMAGKIPIPGMAVYNASKFAAVGLSAAVREEFAPTGVSVSTVLPSAVRTRLSSGVPLGAGLPTVEPETVAKAVVGSVRTRRAEIPVPGYLSAWDLVATLPAPVLRGARRLVNDRRALTDVNPAERAAYEATISDLAGSHHHHEERLAAGPRGTSSTDR